jgi:hypothetical protein
VEGSIRIRLFLRREWLDRQLEFRDLKAESGLNILSPEEQAAVWFPEVVFENIGSEQDWSEMLLSREYNIVRNPGNIYEPVKNTEIVNAFMFSGAENNHDLTKEFTVLWICEFDMQWYPFDTQNCIMQYKIMNKYAKLADLAPHTMSYAGPEELTQYVVKSTKMCRAYIGTMLTSATMEGVEVQVTLGRPLISNLMTVYLPTIIMLVISHIAKVFDQNYMDLVISVNLTVLLVLATL